MRRWALLSLFASAAIGCASAQTPNGTLGIPLEAAVDDDAGPAAGLLPADLPPGTDDAVAMQASDVLNASSDVPVGDSDATDEPSRTPAVMPPFDPGEGGTCPSPMAPGDLVIDELMIESVAGSGDHGEWLEIASTVGCALNLRGLHGNAPSGNKVRTFDVGDDTWIPAFGRFIVADSTSGAINHDLPGTLIVWSGQPGDVLRNKGTTVTIHMNGVMIDVVTYPSMA
ncbi:MAG: lamin tail domain-containing protein, partial [Myxococcota bacterium]|nr:lamin tail domain-containing protein [Myxococcota bacterium]